MKKYSIPETTVVMTIASSPILSTSGSHGTPHSLMDDYAIKQL